MAAALFAGTRKGDPGWSFRFSHQVYAQQKKRW
jgi:hypothetical protein